MTKDTDVLTRERIASMRTNVMSRTAETPSKKKRAMPLIAAAAAIGILGTAGLGFNYALQSTGLIQSERAAQTGGGTSYADMVGDVDVTGSADSKALAPEVGSVASENVTKVSTENVIVTGSLDVRVKNSAKARAEVREKVAALGGRIDNESMSQSEGSDITMTVRVPGTSVDEFTTMVNELGKVEHSSVQRVQVDQQVRDLDARIESLKVSTARLQSIMKNAKNTRDLLDAETQLSQRQAELEGLQAQRKSLGDQTALATIDVTLAEVAPANAVNPGGFRGGLISGWNSLVSVLNATVAGVGFMLPWLIPIGIVTGLGWWIVRRRRS